MGFGDRQNELYTYDDQTKKSTAWAKIYVIRHSRKDRSLISAYFPSLKETEETFLKKLPHSRRITLSHSDREKVEAAFVRKKISEDKGKQMLELLARTGKAVWPGKSRRDRLILYYSKIDASGNPVKLVISGIRK